MTHTTPCPRCGRHDTPKYQTGNDWCVTCVLAEIDRQHRHSRTTHQKPQVFRGQPQIAPKSYRTRHAQPDS